MRLTDFIPGKLYLSSPDYVYFTEIEAEALNFGAGIDIKKKDRNKPFLFVERDTKDKWDILLFISPEGKKACFAFYGLEEEEDERIKSLLFTPCC